MQTLLNRIVEVIQDGGASGVKRGQLIQRIRGRAEQVDLHIAWLQTQNYITIQEIEGAGWGQRGYTRYLFNPHAIDRLDDLPTGIPDSFVANDLGLPRKQRRAHHTANCQMCGKRLALQQGGGRPRKFCDVDCRGRYFQETSTQTGDIMHRADQRTRHRVAYYLVAANLISRGGISFPPDGCPLGRIIFGSKLVDVVVANSSDPNDYYKDPTGGDIKAVVTLDGRIRYEPPFPDAEKEAAPIDDESTGA
jgi:hypothetical protein